MKKKRFEMEEKESSVCVICEAGEGTETERDNLNMRLSKETFMETRVLERTLEMLLQGTEGTSGNIGKKMLEVLTRKEGNEFCLTCLTVIYEGMKRVAEILENEERLKMLSGRFRIREGWIRSSSDSVHKKDKTTSLSRDEGQNTNQSRKKNILKSTVNELSGIFVRSRLKVDNEADKKVSSDELRKKSNSGAEDPEWCDSSCEKMTDADDDDYERNIRKAKKRKRRHSKSSEEADEDINENLNTPRSCNETPGVRQCPSCDFRVDIRTPAQAKMSPESLRGSLKHRLNDNAKNKVASHYLKSHLPATAKEDFKEITEDGKTIFKCPDSPECSYKNKDLRYVVRHYMSFHSTSTQRIRTNKEENERHIPKVKKRKRRHSSSSSEEANEESDNDKKIRNKIGRQIKVPGVQHCPSCDFKVDVRSKKEAKQSPQTMPQSLRDRLNEKSMYKLEDHFKSSHLPANAEKNSKLKKHGETVFKCFVCPQEKDRFRSVVRHYIKFHVKTPTFPNFEYSCPEDGCTFVADNGNFKTNSDLNTHLRCQLASHVILAHDMSHNKSGHLVSKTRDNQMEYRCTRCDFKVVLKKSNSNRLTNITSRKALYRHFFNSHLQQLMCKP